MDIKDFETPVDADINNIYEIEITATDNAGATDTEGWSVTVVNVAEEVFDITAISDDTVNENETYTGPTPEFTNGTTPVTFAISGGADKDLFTIDTSTGVVSMDIKDFETPVDADINNIYEIEITATDNAGATDTEGWSVTVVNVAEEVFDITAISDDTVNENETYTGPTPEFTNGTTPVTFAISGGADKDLFTIDTSTGVVSMDIKDFETPVDADINNIYEIEITATDNAGATDTEGWSVTVVNVAEEVFDITAISDDTVNENETYTGPTPEFTNGTTPVTFAISGGADKDLFTIDTSTGVVSMDIKDFETPVDADINNIYEIEITATDNAGATDTEGWSVTVVNVAEEVFDITAISDDTVNENETYTGPTPEFTNGTTPVTFAISGGADKDLFTIDTSTGVVSMDIKDFETPVDADINNIYEIEITATDNAGATDTEGWSVTVVNVAEEVFDITAISDDTVNENETYTGPTPEFTNGTTPVTFAISGGADKDLFTIDTSTGVVSMDIKDFETPVDADINNIYEIEITATDNAGATDTEGWSVTVVNVAEEVFDITAISDDTVNENETYTGPTPEFTNGTTPVTFAISGGADKDLFTIDTSTGVVSMDIKDFETPVDADINNIYEIEITATDNAGATDTEGWSVTVVNVAEEVFDITAISDDTVNENETYTGPTPEFTNGTTPVTFAISGGADKDLFTIDTSTGVVSMDIKDFETPVDADINNIYEIEITATDNAGATDTEGWSVTVVNVAEEVFDITAISDDTVNENETYTGPTPEFTNGTTPVTFAISGGADKDLFTIDTSTGVVSMDIKDFETPVDADINNIYEIEITATDNAGATDTEGWSVTVVNVAEVFDITAISDDTVNENETYTGPTPEFTNGTTPVTFAISGGADKDLFTIDTSTGVVSMDIKDFETPVDADINNIYEIEITATDNAGATDTEGWSVTVVNVAEEVFDITAISDDTVNENETYTGPTPEFTNGTTPVTFAISGGADKDLFTIDTSTGVVSMDIKDFETPVDADINNIYEIEITATDNAGATDTEGWSVTVVNVAEEVFDITAISDDTVNENETYTGPTPEFTNGTTPVTFAISGGADKDLFTIDTSTGVVSMDIKDFETPVDADINNIYEIEITATDNAGATDTEGWSVTVVNVAEEVFDITAISDDTVNENETYTGPTPEFTNGTTPVTFAISGGADKDLFTIDTSTGVVSMDIKDFETPVDADINNIYEIEITATDNAGATDTEGWSVTVVNVAEEVFDITAISDDTVNENETYTGPTPEFTNGTTPVTFAISGGADKDLFTIDTSTGVVSMDIKDFETPVDADINNIYEIEITATDNAGATDTEGWSVTVVNVAEEVFDITAISDDTVNENETYTGPTPEFTNGTTPVTFAISGGADKDLFTIDTSTGVVSMDIKDFETPVDADINNIYEIEITATDNAGATDTEGWSVTVVNVAEEVFDITAISDDTVNENETYTGPTPEFTNGTTPVTFAISGGADKDLFTIDTSTGVVSMDIKDFETPVDADINNIYEIEITATDNAGATDTEGWSVTVVNVAEEVFDITAISDE